jgi:epoxyqueuosine reductase
MSNKAFKEKYGYMAGSWRGKNPIKRNAIYALANLKSRDAGPLLKSLAIDDPRQEIREAARWAIKQLKL